MFAGSASAAADEAILTVVPSSRQGVHGDDRRLWRQVTHGRPARVGQLEPVVEGEVVEVAGVGDEAVPGELARVEVEAGP